MVRKDDPLEGDRADRAVELRRLVPAASVVDAAVAATAEHLGGPNTVVEVLTCDVADLRALAAHLGAGIDVIAL